jgi:hypothetical protein
MGVSVRMHKPQLVGISASLTTTMQNMKSKLEALGDLHVRSQAKVIVAGAPLTEAIWSPLWQVIPIFTGFDSGNRIGASLLPEMC